MTQKSKYGIVTNCVEQLKKNLNGRIAQLGEHLPYKQGVIGSIPVAPTKMAW